jgi:DNA invertase Pin-like site-specific DNA recombinase
MLRCMKDLTLRQAREMLSQWAAEQASIAGKRDEVVRLAVAAGVSKNEVHKITGIARTTVSRIIDAAGEGEGAGQ